MPVVVIANPKGGVGKSTLSTNVAGYYASRGHGVMLGDAGSAAVVGPVAPAAPCQLPARSTPGMCPPT